jgi:hypothetical protein
MKDELVFALDEPLPLEMSKISSLDSCVSSGLESLTEPLAKVSLNEEYIDIHNYSIDKQPQKVSMEDFELKSVIGKGAYGKVYLVRKKGSTPPAYYAMKVLKKATIILHGKDTEHTRNERTILEEVQHPFIVKLHYAFQTLDKLFLILSYAPGTSILL